MRFLSMGAAEIDPGDEQLLPGESAAVESSRRDDAEHWLRVYEELYGFKHKLLAMVDEQASKVRDDGRAEVDRDEAIFRREAHRLASRLEFWKGKVESLGR